MRQQFDASTLLFIWISKYILNLINPGPARFEMELIHEKRRKQDIVKEKLLTSFKQNKKLRFCNSSTQLP